MAVYENPEVRDNWSPSAAFKAEVEKFWYYGDYVNYRTIDINPGQWFLDNRMRHMYKSTFFEAQWKNIHPPHEKWRAYCGHEMFAKQKRITDIQPDDLDEQEEETSYFGHNWNSSTCKHCYARAIKYKLPVFSLNTLISGHVVRVNGENFIVNENFKLTAEGDKVP